MSRIPQPSSSTPRSPQKSKPSLSTSTARARSRPPPSPTPQTPTQALRPKISLKSLKPPNPSQDEKPDSKPLSIKEQIALRRAEVKKVTRSGSPASGSDFGGLEDTDPIAVRRDDGVDVWRWSVKETIERARSSDPKLCEDNISRRPHLARVSSQGAINLASRALPCLPSALFEIHLGITPKPLKSVPDEPPITSSDEGGALHRKAAQNAPLWFEAHDLEILKVWSNEIVEIQPELSMFGSLKIIDLHNNKLTSLPDSFTDLTALTSLDLSHNQLTAIPAKLFTLPSLTTLNISHNELTALPFRSPFEAAGAKPLSSTKDHRSDWFSQSITRATTPLPRLVTFNASHNHLHTSGIDHAPDSLPSQLSKLDLSANPLGECKSLIRALAQLDRLRELRLQHADVGDDSFPLDLFSSFPNGARAVPFPVLRLLDMEETHVTRPAIQASFGNPPIAQELDYDVTTEDPREGVLRVVLGKRVIKEAWEIEADRRMKVRTTRRADAQVEESLNIGGRPALRAGKTGAKTEGMKEPWEIEAEQGLLTEGARRRLRAAAAAQLSASPAQPLASSPKKKLVVAEKEAWEIDAEQGMLTAGAQRRARAATAAANAQTKAAVEERSVASSSPSSAASALSNPQLYDTASQTLTLPPSIPPSKIAHNRSISLAAPSWAKGSSPLAENLKVLVLTRRKEDPSFSSRELTMDGCNLGDTVPVAHTNPVDNTADFSTLRTSEPLLPLLARLFPSLRSLDLSYNVLTSAALSQEALSALILAVEPEHAGTPARKGLRHLRLRGNRITELDGFQGVASLFKGNRDAPGGSWRSLIFGKTRWEAPAEIGFCPRSVLVDGNIFRVPPRRVWEGRARRVY
ncbi:L domain-like protein [Amylocystis lapponica]|nr:L domain-like protein [Amylocystis lapponica]